MTKRTYELGLVLDPTLTDEEQGALVTEYKKMLTDAGAEIVKEESWGKRKLAYEIEKVGEGRYVILYLISEGDAPSFSQLETRLNQNERVMRYLVVRTDEMIKRALRRGKAHIPAAEAVGLAPARPEPEPTPVAEA
ncbi:MAG: 30S ribosomal protein S6 [Thermoanaerobaculia bacterium]|nr:30S ribosomal protein S6 [Thermoanaerobaculia bacterium]